ncbi:MAG: cell envelope integrity EipB family protein [Oricola sp.]|nr:cell envelope integrity EipB family protein [Oricola sp.]
MTSGPNRTIALAAICLSSTYALPSFAMPQTLAPHRAVYDVALKEASDRSGISGMDGRIVYEFLGSVCDGYTTNFRFVTRIRSASGNRLTDQQTTTYEDGAGEKFRFVNKSFVDEKLDREVSGMARREDDQIIVDLWEPEKAELALEPALFPSAHMLDLIERARSGETFYETKIFDGSEDADRVLTTTVVIGQEKMEQDGDAKAAEVLKDDPYRNVSISYFDESAEDHTGESLPNYQIAFKLYENGVTRDLLMDYGDFSLTAHLTQLDLLPRQSCEGE